MDMPSPTEERNAVDTPIYDRSLSSGLQVTGSPQSPITPHDGMPRSARPLTFIVL